MTSKLAHSSDNHDSSSLRLFYFGPARLEYRGKIVKLRRKSLAILYYLALEGPTRRQVLADLLWEQLDSSRNLRVELHNLKKTLGQYGVQLLNGTRDPLALPDQVHLDRRDASGEPLEGLEDLAPEFHTWLEQHRAKANPPRPASFVHKDLVREMARKVRLPYLLILSGQPGSGHYRFAEALARELGLPITTDTNGGSPAVRYLSDPHRHGGSTVDRILGDDSSLWVLKRPTFGEDPEFLLQLRSSFSAEQISYLELPPLTWQEVDDQLIAPLPFPKAAELFSYTGGHPGFLRELLALKRSNGVSEPPILPQRIRAAYQLEARQLSTDARFALERASVHPGVLSDGLLAAFEIEPQLVELARRNWLTFDGGWRFNGGVPRTVIYLSLPPGHARLYHQVAARQLAVDGNHVAAAYHRSVFEGRPDWESISRNTEGWVQRLASERAGAVPASTARTTGVSLGQEHPLLETDLFGRHVQSNSGSLSITRQPLEAERTGAEWQLSPESGVLHLKGRIFAKSTLDVGLQADAVPLRIDFLGAEPRSVIFADVRAPQTLTDGTLLLPLRAELDCYLRFEQSLLLRIWTAAEAAVIEMTATVYAAAAACAEAPIIAYDLTRPRAAERPHSRKLRLHTR